MSGQFQVFEPAWTFMDARLTTFLNQDVSNVIAQVAGPARAALTLYVLLYGFAILRGAISDPIMDFAIRSLKLAFIYMLTIDVPLAFVAMSAILDEHIQAAVQRISEEVVEARSDRLALQVTVMDVESRPAVESLAVGPELMIWPPPAVE